MTCLVRWSTSEKLGDVIFFPYSYLSFPKGNGLLLVGFGCQVAGGLIDFQDCYKKPWRSWDSYHLFRMVFYLFFCGYHVFRDVFLVFLFCFSLCFDLQRVFTTLTSHNFSSTGSKLGKILGRVNLSNFILSSVFQPKIWEGNWATTFMKSCEDLICACAQLQTSNGASNPSSFFPWLDMEVS